MGYSRDVYESANKTLELLRQSAVLDAENRKTAFYLRCPRAQEIEKLLSATAVGAAKAVLNGADTKEQLTLLKEKNLALQQELALLLKNAGLPEDYLEIHFHCTNCKDEGYLGGKMCDCFKKILRQEAYKRLNKLSPLSLSSFESFSLDHYSSIPPKEGLPSPKKRMEDIFRYCKEYAINFSLSSKSLLMQGATGLGKTHLSLAIAKIVIDKGFGVIYGSTPNIVSKLEKERFRYNNRDEQSIESEQHLIGCDLLILDDLGTEFPTSFSTAAIYNIINSRIMLSKPTIISTNLSMKELEKCYTERLVSRIMGNNIRLAFLGNDIRQQKAMRKKQPK